jgi:hypothetical protein
VEKSRGKKGKKGLWHLTLGLKDTIFAGIGVVGLMMMSFTLGALAGRGDIYRAAYSWGLMTPDASRVAQWSPGGTPPVTAPPASQEPVAPAGPEAAPAAPAPAPATPAPATTTTAVKGSHPAPVTGSIAAAPTAAAAKKKGKSPAVNRDPKSKEEEMRRVRQEVVRKLKFQNSFDTPPKTVHKPKDKEKTPAKTTAKTQQVRVGQFRDSKAAKAKVAQLQKQGVKATLKQTKDQKGTTLYEVYKPGAACPPASEKVAQKPAKAGGAAAKKPKAE